MLAGNPGKRPAQRGRGRIRNSIPDCPPELTGEAAAEWDRLIPELDAAGVLAVTDRGILTAYCCAYSMMVGSRNSLNTEGYTLEEPIQNSKGETIGYRLKDNLAVRMLERAMRAVQKIGAELGITPASRSRIEGGEAIVAVGDGNKVVAIRDRIQARRNG